MTNYTDELCVNQTVTFTFDKTLSVSSEILEEYKVQRFIEIFIINLTVKVETI